MMDRRQELVPLTALTPSCKTERQATPAMKNDRMRLWNQSDIGWNKRNKDNNEDNGEGSALSSSLQCEWWPNMLAFDTPKRGTITIGEYKPVRQWKTTRNAQWFTPTDTAWSGYAQPPGRIVFPQRFEDAEWNVMNEMYWLTRAEGITPSLGIGWFIMLICTQAWCATVPGLTQLWKASRAEHEAVSAILGAVIKSRQPTGPFHLELCFEACQFSGGDGYFVFGHECYECECVASDLQD